MSGCCRACITKDQLIIAQSQIIDELRQKIATISQNQSQEHPEFHPTTSVATVINQRPDGTYDLPTVSYIDFSSLTDVHGAPLQFLSHNSETHNMQLEITPVHIVEQPLHLQAETDTVQIQTQIPSTPPAKTAVLRRSPLKKNVSSPRGKARRPNIRDDSSINTAEKQNAAGCLNMALLNTSVVDSDENTEEIQADTIRTSNPSKVTHVLVLGTPHTRKIPLKCPIQNCPNSDYKAWDRDLLRKHFERHHHDTHPSPVFNYLCPVNDCQYISYNEPSYGLYTHIKDVHQDYLSMIEEKFAVTDREQTLIEERNIRDFKIDKLPSEIPRTIVRVLGTVSMEKEGLRCPLPVCQHGVTVFKSSSNKRLLEHFQKVHSFTHPHPEFIFVCPVTGCKYESDVGNFRVYKHIKAAHKNFPSGAAKQPPHAVSEICIADVELPEQPNAASTSTVELETHSVGSPKTSAPKASKKKAGSRTKVILRGSHNMVLDPMKCPLENCPRPGFIATSTAVMNRHFQRFHRKTHPNPDFVFSCPVEECTFMGTKHPTQSVWRHLKASHPEYLELVTSLNHLTFTKPDSGTTENAEEVEVEITESDEDLTKIRVEAVTDALHPGTLVHPPQFRCLYPGCEKPPFSGVDKTQLLRHYANFHRTVDRSQPINLRCPFQNCAFNCNWPAKPLNYHVRSVHAAEASNDNLDISGHSALDLLRQGSSPVKESLNSETSTPVRIMGRPFSSGEFWCPIPGCGYSNGVLLHLRRHIGSTHAATHPNPTYIYACPLQGCSYAKQHYYQALCTHMQREHGLKRVHTEQESSEEPNPVRKKRKTVLEVVSNETVSTSEGTPSGRQLRSHNVTGPKSGVRAGHTATNSILSKGKNENAEVIEHSTERSANVAEDANSGQLEVVPSTA